MTLIYLFDYYWPQMLVLGLVSLGVALFFYRQYLARQAEAAAEIEARPQNPDLAMPSVMPSPPTVTIPVANAATPRAPAQRGHGPMRLLHDSLDQAQSSLHYRYYAITASCALALALHFGTGGEIELDTRTPAMVGLIGLLAAAVGYGLGTRARKRRALHVEIHARGIVPGYASPVTIHWRDLPAGALLSLELEASTTVSAFRFVRGNLTNPSKHVLFRHPLLQELPVKGDGEGPIWSGAIFFPHGLIEGTEAAIRMELKLTIKSRQHPTEHRRYELPVDQTVAPPHSVK